MAQPPTAHLLIITTSPGCVSYRLIVDERPVWTTRAYPTAAGDAEARERMARWATAHAYRVVDPATGNVLVATPAAADERHTGARNGRH
jgi:hypothetical protein